MGPEIFENIQKLKEQFLGQDAGAMAEIREWERRVRSAIATSNARKNIAITMIIDESKKRIRMANAILINDRGLTERERDKIFERRDSYQWFVDIFEGAESTLREIERNVKFELG